MQSARTAAFYKMEVWDAAGPGAIHFDNGTLKVQSGEPGSELGYMIENSIIQSALHDKMKSIPSIKMFCPANVEAVELGETQVDWVTVRLKGGESLQTRLVVCVVPSH